MTDRRVEIIADILKKAVQEIFEEEISVTVKNKPVFAPFDDLNSAISILEQRKKEHPRSEELNLFLLLCTEIYDLKKAMAK
jgi:hypothetical protein